MIWRNAMPKKYLCMRMESNRNRFFLLYSLRYIHHHSHRDWELFFDHDSKSEWVRYRESAKIKWAIIFIVCFQFGGNETSTRLQQMPLVLFIMSSSVNHDELNAERCYTWIGDEGDKRFEFKHSAFFSPFHCKTCPSMTMIICLVNAME